MAAATGAMSEVCGTHVLLADVCLLRREDEVEVIGAAIEAHVAREGASADRGDVGGAGGHVRDWLRRFDERAGLIRALFARCAVGLDPMLGPIVPAGSGVADALEALAVAARAWVLRFGPGRVWRIASRLSAGRSLAGNTSCLATGWVMS